MFDVPLDTPPVLAALAIVAATTFGVATALAPTPPADATRLAGAVDRVAASPVDTVNHHRTSADAIRITPNRIWTRDAAGDHAATFATGPITPVRPDSRLERVLDGDPPSEVFRTQVDFELALTLARDSEGRWRQSPRQLRVRRVSWKEVDATLVGI